MNNTIRVPHILLPIRGTDMSKYSVIACDQYTSNFNYWNSLSKYIDNSFSTLHMIYPEAYLDKTDNDAYINIINKNMASYLKEGKFEDIGECFILVERNTSCGNKRLGLVIAVDLEDYSFVQGNKASIMASEATVLERIPPRVKIRKDAPIELPHTMLLFNDKDKTVIEPLYEHRESLECLYDFELNKNGGHIRGYKVNPADVLYKFQTLSINDTSNNGLLFVVGDGNHSLAAAKAHWDTIKINLSKEEMDVHPARFALVEVNNLYDEGIKFEPIHRVIMNVKEDFLSLLTNSLNGESISYIYLAKEKKELHLPADAREAYIEVQRFIDEYVSKHPETIVDYVHDEKDLMNVVDQNENSIGISMPSLSKDNIFSYLNTFGVLPRKSFSIGHSNEKRYYIEAKLIIKNK